MQEAGIPIVNLAGEPNRIHKRLGAIHGNWVAKRIVGILRDGQLLRIDQHRDIAVTVRVIVGILRGDG